MIKADYVVHATNAYVSHLLPELAGFVIPVRGQVMAVRSSVPRSKLWNNSWIANEGFEYFFPRPSAPDEKPLVILGGGRESASKWETNNTDDSVYNEDVSKTLDSFLPAVFPDKFENGHEMEWVSTYDDLRLFAHLLSSYLQSGIMVGVRHHTRSLRLTFFAGLH